MAVNNTTEGARDLHRGRFDVANWDEMPGAPGSGTAERVMLTDTGAVGRNAGLDDATFAQNFVPYEHHEIHEGSHFICAEGFVLGSGASRKYLITTPDTTRWSHMIFQASSGLGATAMMYEDSDRLPGVGCTVVNSNRNSAVTSTTTIHTSATGGTTDGNLLTSANFGSTTGGGSRGGGFRSEEELVLKQNTKYVFLITSGANNNNITAFFTWYEHTSNA